MGQISATQTFTVAPEKVWDTVTDLNSFESWLSLHQKWKSELPATIAVGTQVTEVVSMMGMPNTITWNVDTFDAPHQLSMSGEGMAGVKITIAFALSASGEGTTLEMSTDFQGQMIVGALGKAIEKQGAVEVETSLGKLAEILG